MLDDFFYCHKGAKSQKQMNYSLKYLKFYRQTWCLRAFVANQCFFLMRSILIRKSTVPPCLCGISFFCHKATKALRKKVDENEFTKQVDRVAVEIRQINSPFFVQNTVEKSTFKKMERGTAFALLLPCILKF
jgi:hypothetical protein